MLRWVFSIVLICSMRTTGFPNVTGSFGLTSTDSLVTFAFNLEDNQRTRSILASHMTNAEVCDVIPLLPKQKKMCKRQEGMGRVLIEAMQMSVLECQFQFRLERWNCSLGPTRENILQKGFKETAFLYAVTSASLVYTVSRACSTNKLERCTCHQSRDTKQDKEAWLWGGCGDNVKYALKFTNKFLRDGEWGQDGRAMTDKHNSRLGERVVKKSVKTVCKCHGVSASCSMRTCWKQVRPFQETGNTLKQKYLNSVKVTVASNHVKRHKSKLQLSRRRERGEKARQKKPQPPGKGQLVYMDKSPSYCNAGPYGAGGTQGRYCEDPETCGILCCGRGYNIQEKTVSKACNCEVIWCCEVKCDTCQQVVEIYRCK